MGKKSSKTTTKTVYGKTTTTNPYVSSKTDNNGTESEFKKGTALYDINKFVNSKMNGLLQEYLNPTLNSVTNQAKLNSYINTLNNNSAAALENNVINPLSKRNMIRSSQATNMYNNLVQNNANQIANYAQELLAGSQKDTASLLSTLMLLYMNGYNVLNDTQRQSLSASQGNATGNNTTASQNAYYSNMSNMMATAVQLALSAGGL